MNDYRIDLLQLLIEIFGRDRIYREVDPQKLQLKTCVVDPSLLLPHEDIDHNRLKLVVEDIIYSGYVKYPVVVDVRTFIVLDGHHRVRATEELGLKYVPVFFVDYLEDYIDVRPSRKDIPISKQLVIRKVYWEGKVYPPKTTRHIYNGIVVPASYAPLTILRGDFRNTFKILDILCL